MCFEKYLWWLYGKKLGRGEQQGPGSAESQKAAVIVQGSNKNQASNDGGEWCGMERRKWVARISNR